MYAEIAEIEIEGLLGWVDVDPVACIAVKLSTARDAAGRPIVSDRSLWASTSLPLGQMGQKTGLVTGGTRLDLGERRGIGRGRQLNEPMVQLFEGRVIISSSVDDRAFVLEPPRRRVAELVMAPLLQMVSRCQDRRPADLMLADVLVYELSVDGEHRTTNTLTVPVLHSWVAETLAGRPAQGEWVRDLIRQSGASVADYDIKTAAPGMQGHAQSYVWGAKRRAGAQ